MHRWFWNVTGRKLMMKSETYSFTAGSFMTVNKEQAATLLARDYKSAQCVSQAVNERTKNAHYIVRSLTPLECERLQGFPDGWTSVGEWRDCKGKQRESTDSARYKALGNSIAIPPWKYVLGKLSAYCGGEATMASLFDGIGGFPYIWESLHGKGACVWASEIEDFPIAVTKAHFPDE